MGKIDYSQMVTARTHAAVEGEARRAALKAACSARIRAVLDPYTTANLQGAAIAGMLDAAQMAAFRSGQDWVAAMRGACRAAIAAGDDPAWPEPPEALVDLAAEF